jgi:hypothetical protein
MFPKGYRLIVAKGKTKVSGTESVHWGHLCLTFFLWTRRLFSKTGRVGVWVVRIIAKVSNMQRQGCRITSSKRGSSQNSIEPKYLYQVVAASASLSPTKSGQKYKLTNVY